MSDLKTEIKYVVGCFAILGAIHATLKLLGITAAATWSWGWVVMTPILGALAVCVFMMASDAAFLALWKFFKSRDRREK